MARADTASASLRSDSIQGLAKSIAKPAYRRLLSAEPLLRRAVPVLIIAFLITICIGAVVQVLEQRRQVIGDARQVDRGACRRTRHRLRSSGEATQRQIPAAPPRRWSMRCRPGPRRGDRSILVADADGTIVASVPNDPQKLGRPILDVLGPSQPLTTFGAAAGTLEITLPDGAAALATVRALRNPLGILAVVETASSALANWRSTTALTVTLSATTGFVVLILGFAFHWQATRAREADLIHDTVRGRIDTALNRGRCGLWDWDLARGRVFWSHSMFDMLGLPAKDELLTFGEVNALVHDGDIDLYELATATRRRRGALDRSRLPHASRRRPLAVAAGALRIGAPGRRSRTASDRHRRRRFRAEEPGREDDGGGFAAARRHRDHTGSLRAVGRRQSPGAVQFEFPGAASPARRGGGRGHAL